MPSLLTRMTAVIVGAAAQRRPNVLLFMPDDMDFLWPEAPVSPNSPPAWSAEFVPHMNRIRTEGTIFAHASAAGVMCAPARYNLLTGRFCSRSEYAGAARQSTDDRVYVSVPNCKIAGGDLVRTIPATLQASGYRTIHSGKFHLSPTSRGVDEFSSYAATSAYVQSVGFDVDAGTYASNLGGTRRTFSHNIEWMTALSRAAITDAVSDQQPFFLYFASTMPHAPNNIAALQDFDDTATPNGTLAVSPLAASGMPSRDQTLAAAGGDGRLAGTIITDHALGALMGKLEELNVLEETLVICLMDHGMLAKSALLEGGSRIAMFARLPGVIAAQRIVTSAVMNLDIAPTIYEATGAHPTYSVDGQSWWPEATASAPISSTPTSRFIVVEHELDRSIVSPAGLKLITRVNPQFEATHRTYPTYDQPEQLYDLAIDPAEQINRVNDVQYSAALAELHAVLTCHNSNTVPGGSASQHCGTTVTQSPTTLAPTIPASSTSTPTTAAPSTTVQTICCPDGSQPIAGQTGRRACRLSVPRGRPLARYC